jgi:hypothetical protein
MLVPELCHGRFTSFAVLPGYNNEVDVVGPHRRQRGHVVSVPSRFVLVSKLADRALVISGLRESLRGHPEDQEKGEQFSERSGHGIPPDWTEGTTG